MLHNIHNALSDAENVIKHEHFPITARYINCVNDWHNVTFKNEQGDTLEVEVQLDEVRQSVVMGVLVQTGFTNDQRNIIMNIFQDVVHY
jgi:hypothetical protein